MTVGDVYNKVIKEGYRMTFPECTPSEISSFIVQKCWADSPNDRCSMSEVCKFWESTVGIRRPAAPRMLTLYQTTSDFYNNMVFDIKKWWKKQEKRQSDPNDPAKDKSVVG
jgi:hypothetical protein